MMASSTSPLNVDKMALIKEIINDYKQDYNQMFDIIDHPNENYDENLDGQEKWKKIEDEFNLSYEFDNTLANMANENEEANPIFMTMKNTDEEVFEERALSQRLSQLSTKNEYEYETSSTHRQKRRRMPLLTTTTDEPLELLKSPIHIAKKIRLTTTTTTTVDQAILPDYLSSTSQLFNRVIHVLVENPTTQDLDDLRQMAFFMHKITGFRLLHHLWSTYLRSGTGNLHEKNDETSSSINIECRYWPNHVRSQLKLLSDSSISTTATNIRSQQEKEQLACETLVQKRLHEYDEQIESYQKQLNDKTCQCRRLWSIVSLKEAIQLIIDQYGLLPLQMKCQYQTANVRYQYNDEMLKRQFQQQKPTEYQIHVVQRLYNLEYKLETVKYELIEYQQRVICNKPPSSYDSLETTLPTTIQTLSNLSLRAEFLSRYQKLIQHTKTDLMSIDILTKQIEIYHNQTIFNQEVDKMYENIRKQVPNKDVPKLLQSLINKRSLNMKQKLQMIHHYTTEFYICNSYDELETMTKNSNKDLDKIQQRIGFLPTLISSTLTSDSISSYFTRKQIQVLNRGPTYVAPCQIRICSSFSTLQDILMKQYAPLKHQLAMVFSKYSINISRSTNFQQDIHQMFMQFFSIPLSDQLYRRALYEQQLIQSIQSSLQKNNLLLRRTADQNNQFYLSKINDFTCLEQQYMANNSDHYRILFEITQENQRQIQEEMNRKVLAINSELEKLFKGKRFHTIIYKKLCIQQDKIKLPYLYFLPVTSMNTTLVDVKPMIIAHGSGTSKLAHYLKQIIRPLVFRSMNETMFLNEADFMEKLHVYTYKEQKLQPNTLFATIKIKNYDMMASHNTLVTSLMNFLTDNLVTNKIQSKSLLYLNRTHYISIDTIKKLTDLYLENNFFSYHGKIYQFLRGAPNSLLFTELLLNIYMFTYEKFIFMDPKLKSELYGRYKDQIFFTWNQTEDELIAFLNMITNKHPQIQLETSFGKHIICLNAQIENHHGHLYTCVAHDPNQSKYTLPYVIGHTKLNHQLWFRSALIRAIRFCSNFLDFQLEQIYLEMTCLANGYSKDFIETQVKHFYYRFNAEKIRFSLDQNVYDRLRRRLFDFITIQRTLLLKNQELEDEDFIFHFSYPYDYGSYNDFNKNFLTLWNKYFHDDSQLGHKDTKIIFKSKPIYSLNTLFAKEKPTNSFV